MKAAQQSARRAAVWALAAFVVQLVGAACDLSAGTVLSALVCMAAFYLINAYAAYLLKSWVAVAASIIGGLLVVLRPGGTDPAWIGNIAVNLIYLAIYLPMQQALDRRLCETDAAGAARSIGRGWVIAMLIGRGSSIGGFMPAFAGLQAGDELFGLVLMLEVVALIAGFTSYVFMVRYLWRAKRLLAD